MQKQIIIKKNRFRSDRRYEVEVVEASKMLFILIVKKGRHLPRVGKGEKKGCISVR